MANSLSAFGQNLLSGFGQAKDLLMLTLPCASKLVVNITKILIFRRKRPVKNQLNLTL